MRRHAEEQPWPLVAVVVGAISTVVAAVLLIIAATVWLPELPRLLVG